MILILLVVYWNISKRIKIIMGRRWEWRVCSHLQRRSVGKSIFLPKNRRNLWIFIRKLQCPSIIPLRNLLAPFIVVLRLLMTSGMFLSFPSFTTYQAIIDTYIYIYSSALLNAGCKISRSHACPGSLKTTASHREVHDVIRSWIQMNPVKMENIGSGSPARKLLAKESL